MESASLTLPDDIAALKEIIATLEDRYTKDTVFFLREQIRLLRSQVFGRKSEKVMDCVADQVCDYSRIVEVASHIFGVEGKNVDFSSIVVIIVATMRYEWDEKKNGENIRKHGLYFADAWQVFQNPLFVKPDDLDDYGEDRWGGIDMMSKGVVVVLFFTERQRNHTHHFPPKGNQV